MAEATDCRPRRWNRAGSSRRGHAHLAVRTGMMISANHGLSIPGQGWGSRGWGHYCRQMTEPSPTPSDGPSADRRPRQNPEPAGDAEAEAEAEMVVAPGKLTSGGLDLVSVMARSAEIAPVGRVEDSEDVGNRCPNRSIGCNMAIMVCQPERQRFPGKQAVGLPVLETHRIQAQPHGTAQRRRLVLEPCQSKFRACLSGLMTKPSFHQ